MLPGVWPGHVEALSWSTAGRLLRRGEGAPVAAPMQFDTRGLTAWSFPVFRIRRIPVRIHALLALMIAVEILRASLRFGARGAAYGAITMSILLVTIVLHELCHCWMATRHGGRAYEILLWPLGGLAFVDHRRSLRAEVEVSGIGPVSNLVMGSVAAVAPFAGWYPAELSVPQWFVLHTVRLNLILGLFNCIPVPPLDGGMVLHAVLKHRLGEGRAAWYCSRLGLVVGALMVAWAILQSEMMLAFIGIWILMQSWSMRAQATAFEPVPRVSRARPTFFARWKARRARARSRREAERVVTLLDKAENEGIHALTDDERRILRESRKKRVV